MEGEQKDRLTVSVPSKRNAWQSRGREKPKARIPNTKTTARAAAGVWEKIKSDRRLIIVHLLVPARGKHFTGLPHSV